MKAQSRKLGKLVGMALLIVAFLTISFTADASYYRYNRNNARKTINKTAYIIDEAYSIANYYDVWSGSYLSRAVYYNEYAQDQFHRRNYRRAVQYSIKAREYALRVIDGCDSYWDYYYYENYGWSRNYGYNPYYSGYYGSGYYHGNYNNYYNTYYTTFHNNYSNNSNSNYNPNRPQTYNDGRGSNGRTDSFDPNKPSTSGNQTGSSGNRSSFKNINTDNYFDQSEVALINDLPSETNMEETFKQDNRNVSFNDQSLRTNTKLIENNRSRSQEFAKSAPETQRTAIKLQEPKKIEEVVRTRESSKDVRTREGDPEQRRTNDSNERRMTNPQKQIQNRTINQNENSRENRNIREIRPVQREVQTPVRTTTKEVKTETRTRQTETKVKQTETNKTSSEDRKTSSPTRNRR